MKTESNLGGGGGGGNLIFFVKRVFKIAVAQLTWTHDQHFEGVVDRGSQPPNGSRGAVTPIFGPLLAAKFFLKPKSKIKVTS